MRDTITLICATDEFIDFMDSDPDSPCHGKKLTLVKDTKELYREGTDGALSTLSEETITGVFGPEWRTLRTELRQSPKKDMVDKPAHYSRYGIETIDALKGTMSPEEFNGFLKGNAFKYLTRAGAKDSLEQDLHKVCWYAMFLYLQNGGSVESLGKTYEYMEGRFTK